MSQMGAAAALMLVRTTEAPLYSFAKVHCSHSAVSHSGCLQVGMSQMSAGNGTDVGAYHRDDNEASGWLICQDGLTHCFCSAASCSTAPSLQMGMSQMSAGSRIDMGAYHKD
jgi:hypothetical protein